MANKYIDLHIGGGLVIPSSGISCNKYYPRIFEVKVEFGDLYRSKLFIYAEDKMQPINIRLKYVGQLSQPARIHKKRRIQKKWLNRFGRKSFDYHMMLDNCTVSMDSSIFQNSNEHDLVDVTIVTYNEPKYFCLFGPTAKSEFISYIGPKPDLD